MYEASRRVGPWRERIALQLAQFVTTKVQEGPVDLDLTFVLPRPRRHYTAKGELRPSAPELVSTRPDLDKLCRAVLDAAQGIVYQDDAQVCSLRARKVYGQCPGVTIRIAT